MRIGLVSDTHVPESRKEIYSAIVDVFQGVDLILHGGDIAVERVLDDLAQAAPVLAAEGNHDRYLEDDRIKKVHVIEAEGFTIGLTHQFLPYEWDMDKLISYWMGGIKTDIIVFGDSHYEKAEMRDGVLVINPGSAMYPHNQSTRLGHVAFLDLEAGRAPQPEHVEIVNLADRYPQPED